MSSLLYSFVQQRTGRLVSLPDRVRELFGVAKTYDYTLFGPYGAGNIGDDAILDALLSRHFDLRRQRLSIITESPEATRRHVSAAHLLARKDFAAWEIAVRRSAGILLAGGTMISDLQGMRFPFGYSKPLLELARNNRKPHAMMGVGVNSVETAEGKEFFRRLYQNVDVFTVRDDHCANALLNLGVPQDRIAVAADPVFGWRPPEELAREMDAVLAQVGGHPCLVAVNVTHEEWRSRKELYSEVASCCDRLIREMGAGIVFFASDCRRDDPYDSAAIRATIGQMREKALVLPGLNYKPSELATFLGRFHIVLSMRMHPLIFGALGSALPVGIIRQPKMTRVLDEMGFAQNVQAETALADEVFELCRHRFSNLASLRQQMKGRLAILAEREMKNRKALECLGGAAPNEIGST